MPRYVIHIELNDRSIEIVKKILMGKQQKMIAKEYGLTLAEVSKTIVAVCKLMNPSLYASMPEFGYEIVFRVPNPKPDKRIFRLRKRLTYRSSILDWIIEHRSEFFPDLPPGKSLIKEKVKRDISIVKYVLYGGNFSDAALVSNITKARVHQIFHYYCRQALTECVGVSPVKIENIYRTKKLDLLREHKKEILSVLNKIRKI